MEETKNTKTQETKETQETKFEFDFEEEIKKSKVIKSYPAVANFVVEAGYGKKNYQLNCGTKIENKIHTRLEKLSESRHQFMIKFLVDNNVQKYNGEFQVRQNKETGKLFYCWIVTLSEAENYKYPMMVKRDERVYLECRVLPKQYIEKKDK